VRYNARGHNLLGHEHAHNIEYQMLGFLRFTLGIAIPSLFNAGRDSSLIPGSYFNQPWEIHADMLAGLIGYRLDRDGNIYHTTNALLLGLAYFHFISTASISDLLDNVSAFKNHDFSAIKEGWTM